MIHLLPDRIQQRLGDVGDPAMLENDPCLNCSLPFDCSESSRECQFVQITGRRPQADEDEFSDEAIKEAIVAILKSLERV